MNEEEMNKLLKEIQELDKVDSTLESSLILKRKHVENELLKKKVNKYKEVIDKAISHLDLFISDTGLSKYDTLKILMHTKKILKEVE